MVNHCNVFAYGTLRMEREGIYTTMSHFAPISTPLRDGMGEFRLDGYAMFIERAQSVPAVKEYEDGHVIGDVFRVDMMGFRKLLHYEGFPDGYDYELVSVTDPDGDTVEAVVFTHTLAHRFGPRSQSGDFYRPDLVPPRDLTLQEA